jgi:PAS domain S-box-containing protein
MTKDLSCTLAPPSATQVKGLITQLAAAETALEKTLGPGADTVIDSSGQPYLLRQAQAALRQSENRFRALIEKSTDVIALLAPDGSVVYDSPTVTRVLGYAPAELVGQSVFKLFHPDDLARAKRVLGQIQASSKDSVTAIFRCRHKNGTYRRLEGTGTNLLQEPGVKAILLNYRDITERHEAETSLRASEERFRTMLEGLEAGIIVHAADSRITAYNRKALELLGVTDDQMGRRNGSDPIWRRMRVDGSLVPESELPFIRALNTRQPVRNVILGVPRPDRGDPAWMLVNANPVLNGHGAVAEVIVSFVDVTARVEGERELTASENRFRALFEQAAVGVGQTDAQTGRFLRANQRYADILGYTCAEMVSLSFADITHPEDLQLDRENMAQLRAGVRRECAREKRYVRKDGSAVWVSLTVSAIGTPGEPPASFIAVVKDISERKQAESEIQRQAAFAHFNPNPVLELAADGEVNYFNRAASEMAASFGKTSPGQILPPNAAEIVRQCLATSKPLLRIETQTQQRTISWSFFPVLEGQVVHCYAGDITERKRFDEHLRQTQKMEAVGQLSSGVAHDFNNLLTVIQGHVGLMEAKGDLPADVADSIQEIAHAAARATALTRQLLTFSREQAMQPRDIDANEVVNNMSKMLRRVLREDISFKVHCGAVCAPIHADAGMIEQVLVNLVVNARDAMPEGGNLVVEVAGIEISAECAQRSPHARPGAFVRLAVGDTGSGIPPEVLPKIFEPFFTTKEAGKGTGLGLANVYGIVQQHSGWVEVQSEVGRGTTFNVYLPRRAVAAPTTPSRLGVPDFPRGTETILVVEDDPLVRLVLEPLLVRHGYRVLSATDGVAALEIWRQHRTEIQLLLTDIVLPNGIDGRRLAERIVSEEPQLPVIFTSGYMAELAETKIPLREGDNFLAKPFESGQLLRTLRVRLGSRGHGHAAGGSA